MPLEGTVGDEDDAVVGSQAESALVQRANQGERDAWNILYARHYRDAWDLAWVVTMDATSAAAAVASGFADALRGYDGASTGFFGLSVLASVYAAAADATGAFSAPAPVVAVVTSAHSGTKTAGATTLREANSEDPWAAAFARLPGRWRAAVWLQQVHGLGSAKIGFILGLSAEAAGRLLERATDNLARSAA
jgi:DNA-directed RNA polymerase specialized sigma24 family protein